MTAVFFDAELSADERRARLYAGDIFIFSPTPGARELVKLARDMLEEAFAPHDPRHIHEVMTAEQVADILSKLKPAFIHHPECKKLLPQILAEHGENLDKVFFDVPRMRSAYPSHFLTSGIAYAFHPHRDTWYSAPTSQLNWWMPIFPIDPNNAMGFYPRHFTDPVKNSSAEYNYYEWNAKNRASASAHVKTDTRVQPRPQQELDPVKLTYLPPPGGMIVFSGAQLHESTENTTALARYSIDFRTVHVDDVRARTGAPNIDSACSGTTMRDYLRGSDLSKLPDELIELHDDETAEKHKLHYFGDRLVRDQVGEM